MVESPRGGAPGGALKLSRLFAKGRARWTLMLVGILLSLGAPLGLRALWAGAAAVQLHLSWQTLTLTYVAVATACAFAGFGYSTGVLVDALESARQALALEATHDPLTGLLNRRAFNARLQEALQRSQRTGEPVALIMLDVDHFKRVNDQHGHPVGDEVLRAMATHIRSACRAVDAPARYGGEEFAVIAPGLAPGAAAQVAERIRAAVAEGVTLLGTTQIRVTISAGVAVAGPNGGEAQLIRDADDMLFKAKQSGRNQVCCTAPATEALAS